MSNCGHVYKNKYNDLMTYGADLDMKTMLSLLQAEAENGSTPSPGWLITGREWATVNEDENPSVKIKSN